MRVPMLPKDDGGVFQLTGQRQLTSIVLTETQLAFGNDGTGRPRHAHA
jgi:hypothetical protein